VPGTRGGGPAGGQAWRARCRPSHFLVSYMKLENITATPPDLVCCFVSARGPAFSLSCFSPRVRVLFRGVFVSSASGGGGGREIRLSDDGDVRLGGVAADRAQLCIRAAELRARHVPFADIARELGLASPAVAQRAVRTGLTLIPSEDVREVRRLSDQRLDRMARKLLAVIAEPGPLVSQGKIIVDEGGVPFPDQMVRTRALEALLKVDGEMRKLHGADAPKRSVTITADMVASRIAELRAELGVSGSGAALEGFGEGEEAS
jgi:hypothetical protein